MPRVTYLIIAALVLGGMTALEVGLPSGSPTSIRQITVEGKSYRVRVVDTPMERAQGLSGTKRLAPDEGMLFVFEQAGLHGFWMKDMNYAIDIIWLNDRLKPVGITKNISPDSFPTIFYPPAPIRYVLEIATKSPQ